ncbi:predicted protein [Naegleria gruberi]|uniref:Predicted protein n=1 Tax=Naegleria gruberi TaxID=5762 RepID=D2V5Z9_NAEGR|nr:uncharacterized protein NAEGRDRAFT_46945 [Naegleria gruberi]EFC47889.1 predicted protein [Naegleria gruberi]|eukprot:XP_002680633.1 predicted protein [Naegleria gruberi strain NEG-M]
MNKNRTPKKKHKRSSPSHLKQLQSDTTSSGSSTAQIYGKADSASNISSSQQLNNQETQQVNRNMSSGASALATSLNLRHADSDGKEVDNLIGKRERDSEGISLKNYLCDCYQSITGESVNDELSTDEIFELLLSVSNEQYSGDKEFKHRMAFLQRVFREEVDAPIPDAFCYKDFRSSCYPILLAQSYIIVQVCKRLRSASNFNLVEWLQGVEFIHNIADLNCIAIKATRTSDTYKSGSTIDDITSKQQEKAVKKAEKLKENKLKKLNSFFQKRRINKDLYQNNR